MAVYFFNKSWVSESGVSASSSGGSDVIGHLPAKVYDYDKITYWENDGATPSLIIDLGVSRLINSLWMYQDNIDDFDLYYSDNGSDWTKVTDGTQTDKGDGIWWWLSFTEVTKRYWKVEITAKGAGNIKVHELMLMELRLTLSADVDLPSMVVVTPKDTIGGSYALVDGSVTSYAGIKAYSDIEITFQNIPSDTYDDLFELFTTPSLRYPLVVIPDDDKPSYIYRCIWADDAFNFKYSQSLKLSGFDGSMKFMEY
jgi:hypothetical protein